ncbi:GNAT family N-acetyltransferase [Lichenibacterium dinghuense]|uniref:GNAT family N-acetyltransferase n=1 Tax=Lichenibacterium dinghuense TaxID=2895977 RepID=UPI001F40D488|nr:GNAT family N-acetyltransferase [Lichenibacterium sp. 6Y81]
MRNATGPKGGRPGADPATTATLRPAAPADAGFLRDLFAADAGELLRSTGLTGEAIASLLSLQLRSRDAAYRERYPEARFSVIEREGVPVGRLVEADGDGFTLVVDIAVAPAWRRSGIAAAVLRDAMARWSGAGRGGWANVFVNNVPSLALFAGLGFTGKAEDGAAQVTMTWTP